jgi:hypothetical protein
MFFLQIVGHQKLLHLRFDFSAILNVIAIPRGRKEIKMAIPPIQSPINFRVSL